MFYHVPNINYILHTFKKRDLKAFKLIIREMYFEKLNIIYLKYSSSKRIVFTCMVGHTLISNNLNCLIKKKNTSQDKLLIDNKIIIFVKFMKD
jgi:hypothetical protein